MKKQNEFADLDDDLSTPDGANSLALIVNFVAFIVFWIVGGSFWAALVITFILHGVIAAAALLVVHPIAMCLARRDYDAPDD
jgi:hypothetical protein